MKLNTPIFKALTSTLVVAMVFWYFIWPDSLESCLSKAAKDAKSSYGFKMLAELCTRPTWVDVAVEKMNNKSDAVSKIGLKPVTGRIDKFLDGQ